MSLPDQLGPYRVLRKLGEGGMGVVYQVQDPDAPRQLALKLISAREASETALERFRREAETLARIRHRSVLRVHQVGKVPEGTYLLMEQVAGRPLDDVLRDEGPLDAERATRIVRELCDALETVHAAGVLHRDVKPGNVILQPDGIPVLLDFGLVRDAGLERLTRTGTTLGTLAYMSPEQAGGESTTRLGPPTDVYALGVVLFELVSGERPFPEESTPVLIGLKLYEEPKRLRAARPDAPRALEAICARALATRAEDRYPSAAALREDLDRYLEGSAPHALEARVRRRPGWPLALLALGLLAGVGVLLLGPRGSAVDPRELEPAADEAAQAARALLIADGLLADQADQVAALATRLAVLEAQLGDGAPGPNLRRARRRVAALTGLLALSRGEPGDARSALERAEGDRDLPATLALRGAVAAVTTASDPAQAARDLQAALSRGLRAAELRGWLARARARSGLQATDAQQVLRDLAELAARRPLDDGERRARIQALLALKRAPEARAELKGLHVPPAALRWAVALGEAELALERDPQRALALLAELPEPTTPVPARARLAAQLTRQIAPLQRRVADRPSRAEELRLLASAELLRRLTPDRALPIPLLQALVDACTRWRNSKYWSPRDAARLGRLLPPRADLRRPLAMMALQLRTPGERKPLLPVIADAIAVLPPGPDRFTLQVARCTAWAQLGQAKAALAEADRLLPQARQARAEERIDLLVARGLAAQRLGRLDEALADLDAALALGTVGKWTEGDVRYHRALLHLEREDLRAAGQDAAGYLEHAAPMMDLKLKERAWKLAWKHAREQNAPWLRRGFERALARGTTPPGWRVRTALLHLRAGDAPAALRQLRAAADALRVAKRAGPGLARRAAAVAAAIAGREADARATLEALVTELDRRRGDGYQP